MPHITLVRHGQANTGATDEISYDRLSDLGHQQAKWLGEYIDNSGEIFSRVYAGTLHRQVDTARSMGAEKHGEIIQDERLNELHYFTMSQLMVAQHGLALPDTREGYALHMPRVFAAWQAGEIENVPETYDDFATRVSDVISEIAASSGRALVVTSGGVIGTIIRQTLNLDNTAWSHICLAIMNSSAHRLHVLHGRPTLAHFNSIAHLETPDRQFAKTHL